MITVFIKVALVWELSDVGLCLLIYVSYKD
jgi:hypothetical protein